MPPPPKRLILIHGAWAGPWIWDGLALQLATLGLPAQALALPGDGTHPIPAEAAVGPDFHDCIAHAITAEPGPVALLGHSGGGMLVTAGAEAFPDRVSHGLWIAGMLIPDGRTFDDVQDDVWGLGNRSGITPHVQLSADGLTSKVPIDAAITHFFQDVPPDQARAAAECLTPQPQAGHRLCTATGTAFAALPKLYIHAKCDQSVLPALQSVMSKSTENVTHKSINTGHAPQLTQPKKLAQIITDWIGKASE